MAGTGTVPPLPELRVPGSIDEIDARWVAAALGESERSRDDSAIDAERIGVGYGLASELFRIHRGGVEPTVVVKLWSTDAPAGEAEVDFYHRYGSDPGIAVPQCHFAAVDRQRMCGVLVLEDLTGSRQGDATEVLATQDRKAVVDAIARFHARWWGMPTPASGDEDRSLFRHMRTPDWVADRRSRYLSRYGSPVSPALACLLAHGVEALDVAADRLDDAPVSLIHGDLHLDNILFVGPEATPVFLDWTRTTVGPAVRSLADLAFHMSPAGTHAQVIRRYRRGLQQCGVDYPEDRLLDDLGAVMVGAVLTWTLGLARWEPATAREERLVAASIERAENAATTWSDVDVDWPPVA